MKLLELGKEGIADMDARGEGCIDVLQAAEDGNIDDVDRWIGGGGDLEVTGEYGRTPLILAALWARVGSVCGRSTDIAFLTLTDCVVINGHADAVKALIKGGAALDATTDHGETALHAAALSSRGRGGVARASHARV